MNFNSFEALGIPPYQVDIINRHLQDTAKHVSEVDNGMEEASNWLKSNLESQLGSEDAAVLFGLVGSPGSGCAEYVEAGYDSNQSHRIWSKRVSELILVGGLTYEYGLLGRQMTPNELTTLLGHDFELSFADLKFLSTVAQRHGAKQDFLFPGVTKTNSSTPPLEKYAWHALSGTPMTSVRNVFGLGGLRYDKDWNYVTDLATFAKLKVTEDKRYYPGLGIFFGLTHHDPRDFPAVRKLQVDSPSVYEVLSDLIGQAKGLAPTSYSGVSVLCSAYIPKWHEFNNIEPEIKTVPDLSGDFHSPSYEFTCLKQLFEAPKTAKTADLQTLKKSLDKLWSFNSPIHLPWTAELAGLSNSLIGRIGNHVGDVAIRYGVGFEGKSLEVVQYIAGLGRNLGGCAYKGWLQAGRSGYQLRQYDTDQFSGLSKQDEVPAIFWKGVNRNGFMQTALERLKDG